MLAMKQSSSDFAKQQYGNTLNNNNLSTSTPATAIIGTTTNINNNNNNNSNRIQQKNNNDCGFYETNNLNFSDQTYFPSAMATVISPGTTQKQKTTSSLYENGLTESNSCTSTNSFNNNNIHNQFPKSQFQKSSMINSSQIPMTSEYASQTSISPALMRSSSKEKNYLNSNFNLNSTYCNLILI